MRNALSLFSIGLIAIGASLAVAPAWSQSSETEYMPRSGPVGTAGGGSVGGQAPLGAGRITPVAPAADVPASGPVSGPVAGSGAVSGAVSGALPSAMATPGVAPAQPVVQAPPPRPSGGVAAALYERLAKGQGRNVQILRGFYQARNFAPVFTDDSGLSFKGDALIAALQSADQDGLTPSDYGVHVLTWARSALEPQALAELEIRLANALTDYGRDLSAGRLQPNKVDPELYIFPQGPNAATILHGAGAAPDLTGYLQSLAPQTPNYARLKEKLAEYRSIAAAGGWRVVVPDGPTMRPGARGPRVALLRARLEEMGDIWEQSADPEYFDAVLDAGVRRFQNRHSIAIDGEVGPRTLAELNVPIERRIAQMVLNMERRRWMEDDLGYKYVFVNLADYELKVVEGDRTIWTTRVVVGEPYNRTPVFSDVMEYVEINPYWNVPSSIARKELLPKIKRDPGYLARNGYELLSSRGRVNPHKVSWRRMSARNFPYRIRQKPGRRNALGRIKFMFPNKFAVYLHDTPSKALFQRSMRAFSHGCIRVQDPNVFGEVVLGDQGWDKARIERQIASKRRIQVRLQNPIPVHIAYITAWVNKDGQVYFGEDVYNRDDKLAKALEQSRIAWH